MNTREFLSAVWPPRGPYCIAIPWVTPDGKEVMAHHGCDTIDDAIAYILVKKPSKDLYFATHGLKVIREENPKTGRLQTFRTKENMREGRDFFFDMDVGFIKSLNKIVYATQADALNKLEEFLFRTGLPSPFVISSGYGVHVHWPVDTPIESMAWVTPAAKLHALAEHHKMYVDPSKVFEPTTVLRVPNTFNYKDSAAPRKVAILAEGMVTNTDKFLEQLDDLVSVLPDAPKPSRVSRRQSREDDTLSVAWDGRHPPADEVAEVCEHMRAFRDSGGNISEPLWHVGVGTLKYCDEGQAKAHEWSSGYDGYTVEETQAKLDNWTTPPPGCEKIGDNSGIPEVCARCPYRDLAKNPIMIANVIYEKTHQPKPAAVPIRLQNVISSTPPCPPPAPYTLDPVYGIRMKKEGIICERPMFPIYWIKATSNENCFSRWCVKPPRSDWEMIDIPNDALEPRALGAALRNRDIIINNPKRIKQVHGFMLSYLNELHKCQDHLRQYDYVGWETPVRGPTEREKPVELGNPKYFIHYNRKISVADGSVTPCMMTENTQLESMGRVGSLDKQIQLMEFYNSPEYMAQQFAICASLATPMFRFSNLHGMLVCLTGDTGASKSTGLYFAASLWGHPELYCLSGLRSNATDKGRQEMGAIYCNLPFCVDEITLLENAVAHEIALSASQLGPFISLTQNRKFRNSRSGFKSNITICTSNKSLIQMVNAHNRGGQAGIMRVFEIKVDRNNVHSKAEADAAIRQLVKNYGWIGEDFLCRCLPHIDAVSDKYLETLQQFETDINASQEERFTTTCAATGLLGAKLGSRLGYFPFSHKLMREWLIDVQIPAVRQTAKLEREHQTPEIILNEYLEAINPHMCRINKNSRGDTEILYAPPQIEFKARYEISKAMMYVRLSSFKDYCNERNHDYSHVLDQLMTNGLITNKQIRKRMRSEQGTFSNPIPCFVMPVKAASPIAVPNVPDDKKIVEFKKPGPSPSPSPPGRLVPE